MLRRSPARSLAALALLCAGLLLAGCASPPGVVVADGPMLHIGDGGTVTVDVHEQHGPAVLVASGWESGMTKAEMCAQVERIEGQAFGNCPGDDSGDIESTTPPTVACLTPCRMRARGPDGIKWSLYSPGSVLGTPGTWFRATWTVTP